MSEEIQTFMVPKLTRGTVLKFTAYAWAKLLFMRDIGQTEVGGYGITDTDDPLLVTDFKLVKQICTNATVELDTEDSIKFLEEQIDKGLSAWQVNSIWIHFHPGNCPNPSIIDEENFNKNFSLPHMAVFYILARGNSDYCRLRFNVGSGTEVIINSMVDYSAPFSASDKIAWKKEYDEKVTESKSFVMVGEDSSYMDWINKWRKDPERLYGKSQQTESIQEKEEMDKDLEMFWDSNENCIWFWNDEEEDHWKYSPVERAFFDSDDSRVSLKDIPKECKISEIIRFGVKCYKDQIEQPIEDSFLREIDEVELCDVEN